MQYFCVAAAVIASGFSGYIYKRISMVGKSVEASSLLPVIWYGILAVFFGILAFIEGTAISLEILLPALLSGVGAAMCAIALLEGMKRNAYAASVIIINLNFVIPVLLSVLFLGENTEILQLVGMLVAVIAIVAVNIGGSGQGQKNTGKKRPYILLALAACVGNGIINFGIKLKQYIGSADGDSAFYSICYLFALVLCLITYGVIRYIRMRKNTEPNTKTEARAEIRTEVRQALPFAVGIALCNGVCFWALGVVARYMNAAAEFTVVTALSIIVSLAMGSIRLKEKMGVRGVLSLIFCAVAILCQCLYLV